mmetsp:Transcript_53923/g.161372  ORF Transcript_53923/g.161372 Transcript_53923/m.161372 type:complete len:242 (+) Transcript_53923:617-1342(+)
MMEGGVNEQLRGGAPGSGGDVPRPALDTDRIGDGAQLLQLTVGDDHAVLAQQCDLGPVGTPHRRLDLGGSDLSQYPTALHLEQNGAIVRPEQYPSGRPTVQQGVNVGRRTLQPLCCLVVQILDHNLTLMTIEDRESIPSQKDRRTHARSPLPVRDGSARVGERKGDELVRSAVHLRADQDVPLGGVVLIVGEVAGGGADAVCLRLLTDPADGGDGDVHAGRARGGTLSVIVTEQLPSPHVV